MDISQIISMLTAQFGNGFDVTKVTNFIKGLDYKSLPFEDIVGKLTQSGLLNGAITDTLKDKAASMLGSKLGGIFGK